MKKTIRGIYKAKPMPNNNVKIVKKEMIIRLIFLNIFPSSDTFFIITNDERRILSVYVLELKSS